MVGNAKIVEATEALETNAEDETAFRFKVSATVPLAEQDGFEHGEQRMGGIAAVVEQIAVFSIPSILIPSHLGQTNFEV